MTDIPNCSNCSDKDDCSEYKYTSVRDVSVRCGLMCHPGAREWMMRDVITELEKQKANKYYSAAQFQHLIQAHDTAIRNAFIEQIEQDLSRYSSDLGDMYLLSDIQSIRTKEQP